MHIATASDDATRPLESVLTARATRAQLHDLWPEMQRPDALASPGPTRVAHVHLSTGHRASVVFHETYDLLEVLAPLDGGVEEGLANLLAKLTIPAEAITWTHDRLDRRSIVAVHALGAGV